MPVRDWDAQHKQPPSIPRPELPSLQTIADPDERFYLRNYLRSNIDRDQDEARKRCAVWGIDYERARHEAQHA